jgi:hypothetical protein
MPLKICVCRENWQRKAVFSEGSKNKLHISAYRKTTWSFEINPLGKVCVLHREVYTSESYFY